MYSQDYLLSLEKDIHRKFTIIRHLNERLERSEDDIKQQIARLVLDNNGNPIIRTDAQRLETSNYLDNLENLKARLIVQIDELHEESESQILSSFTIRIERLESQVRELQSQVRELQSQIPELQSQIRRLQSRIRELESQIRENHSKIWNFN